MFVDIKVVEQTPPNNMVIWERKIDSKLTIFVLITEAMATHRLGATFAVVTNFLKWNDLQNSLCHV